MNEPQMTERVTTRISSGELAGQRDDGIDRYRGIPYAAAPVGARRFAPPEPVVPWQGVRDAVDLGPTAPQTPYSPEVATLLANRIIPGDDFLNVNVWAPAGATGCPVLVWIHGGSLVHGSNALDGYDGTAFARDGVVFVGINYRLGPEGFSVLDDAPVNLGLADVAAALRWVRAEIAAFGGDPSSVTIAGESAGGVIIATMLAAPDASELFDRAVVQSGMFNGQSRKAAGRVTRKLAKRLGIATTREAFASIPSDTLVAADDLVRAGATPLNAKPGYAPCIGDDLVPESPLVAARDHGAGDRIPVLVGWTADEHRLFIRPGSKQMNPIVFGIIRLRFRLGRRVLAAYRRARPSATRNDLFGQLAIDLLARVPFYAVADRRRSRGASPTYVYEFAWPSPVIDLRAAHAMEIGFVFDRLSSPDWVSLTGPDAPQSLATAMHEAWVRFAKTGDPGWQAWDDSHPVMMFDTESVLEHGPHDDELSTLR
jgi:para-nitrobenzyl esterase